MKREILFEYGFESVNGIVKKVYSLGEIPNISKKCDVWNVLPVVYVRQFTGLTDKNGTKIFEGDRLICNMVEYKIIRHESGAYELYEKDEDPKTNDPYFLFLQCKNVEVIGNIHEAKNP